LKNEIRNLVIGTGPCGFAAINALIEKGAKPTVIDIGMTQDCEEAGYIGNQESKHELKSNSGKLFMYYYPNESMNFDELTHAVALSGALGGLSNVWAGGWQLPQRETIGDLPEKAFKGIEFSAKNLISKFEHTGIQDGLSHLASLNFLGGIKIETSQRIQRMHRRFLSFKSPNRFEVSFGQPRLLLKVKEAGNVARKTLDSTQQGSQEFIFNSGEIIAELIRDGKVDYIKGRVTKVFKAEDKIKLNVMLASGENQMFSANKVFLGAGSVGTPLILQNSFKELNEIRIRDSQMFQVVYLSYRRNNWKNHLYSFPQGYFQSSSQSIEFSCSVLENSRQLEERVYSGTKVLGLKGSRILSSLLSPYLMAGIGFISMEKSGEIILNAQNGASKVTTSQNNAAKSTIRKSIRRLRRMCLSLGVVVIGYRTNKPKVGAGFHSGSAFPMCEVNKDHYSTNLLGEVPFCANLHVIDSSSLPRIITGSHTFTAMANADRIAREAGDF
jgi:hypothetical protein